MNCFAVVNGKPDVNNNRFENSSTYTKLRHLFNKRIHNVCRLNTVVVTANWHWGRVGWMLADHRDGLSSSSFLAWSSIAQSVCQRAFSLLAIWCVRLWVQILYTAEEDNMSPFDLNIAFLCQSIEINNKKCLSIKYCCRDRSQPIFASTAKPNWWNLSVWIKWPTKSPCARFCEAIEMQTAYSKKYTQCFALL